MSESPLITRVVNNARIVHNDLALGAGKVDQKRGPVIKAEQMIEIMLIFRTVDEIQHLDTERYTRVALHQEGPVREYWYDKSSEAVPNLTTILKPYVVSRAGRWVQVEYVDHEARRMIKELQNVSDT